MMDSDVLVICGGTLIDGRGGAPTRNARILVEHGKFSAISDDESAAPPTAQVLDATGKFILPGLMNANVHLIDGTMMAHVGGIEYLVRFEGRYQEVIEEAAQIALRSGFTTLFDTWNALGPVLRARGRINAGEVPGARIFAAGNIIGRGGPFTPDYSARSRQSVSTTFADRMDRLFEAGVGRYLTTLPPVDIRPIIRDYIAQGVDFVKIGISDHLIGVSGWDSSYLVFSKRVLEAIADEVRRAGIPLASHTTSVESLQAAVDLETDAMMHVNVTAQVPIPDDLIDRMAKGPGWSVIQPTTAAYQCYLESTNNPAILYAGAVHNDNIFRLLAAGASIILGTDAGFPDPDIINDLPIEEQGERPWTMGHDHIVWLKAMVEKGMTPMDAILAATSNVAKAYCKAEHYGTIEPGKVADLIIVDADPLDDITNIGKLHCVVKDGFRVDLSALPSNPVVTTSARGTD
ncbi:amidohydrolase family protein [Sphingomonas sp. TX0543]|uniref:amidohydrolase family protein n=1 Tax=Sphingomonas sp. TX0543 TaxID=3399682 RepID=UPI003AFAF74B